MERVVHLRGTAVRAPHGKNYTNLKVSERKPKGRKGLNRGGKRQIQAQAKLGASGESPL